MNKETQFTYQFSLTFNRPLSPEEQMFVQQIVGYCSIAALAMPSGEGPSFEWYGDSSVLVYLDTTKSYSDDISFRFPDFWEKIENYLRDGSKPYEKASRGKAKGFQLVPSIGFDAEIVYIFSDDTHDVERMLQSDFPQEDDDVTFSIPGEVATGQKDLTVTIPEGVKSITVTFNF